MGPIGPMKITVSQKEKKLSITFRDKKFEESFIVDKAEDFLVCVDKLIKKYKISSISQIGRIGHIEFHNTGLLTERIIRSIILGLSF